MTTRKAKGKGAADAAAEEVAEARTVGYVLNRPYSAGEAPEVVTAQVKREHEDEPDLLDLTLDAGGDTIKRVRRSERREPGTWHEATPEVPEGEAEGGE